MLCSADMKEHGKKVRLVHNPSAGKEDNEEQDEICKLIEARGYSCTVVQKKDAVKKIDPKTDFIAVAGGDGTVRMTIISLLEKKLRLKRPIAVLPQGTANNIAISLGIPLSCEQAIERWQESKLIKFDVGMVMGIGRKPLHFIESIGFGLFPVLMEKMDKKQLNSSSPEEEIRTALKELRKLVKKFPAKILKLVTSSGIVEKACIMVEVMNISRMGPRLELSPDADPTDGQVEVILVTAEQRSEMITYIDTLLKDGEAVFPIEPIRCNYVSMEWQGRDLHIDDEITSYKGQQLEISLRSGLIDIIARQKK